ncbi:MAG: hypothetical protein P1V81_14540 [Planctomycetota bacterium]|nr:hypothetical protein [Planctomycetota bacterium]
MLLASMALAGACRAPLASSLPDGSAFTRPVELDLRLRAADLQRDALGVDANALIAAPGTPVAELFQEARELAAAAPDWVAPQRLVDDLARVSLSGPSAWARRSAAWQASGSGRDAYLLARLERPERAADLFAVARDRAPDLAWGHHGTAFSQQARGAPWSSVDTVALRAAERAASLHELLVVVEARARFLASAGQRDAAEELVRELADFDGLLPAERASLQAWALASDFRHGSMGLGGDDKDEGGAELREAIALLTLGSGLPDHRVPELVQAVEAAGLLGRSYSDRLRALAGVLRTRLGHADDARLAELLAELEASLDSAYLAPGIAPGPRPSGSLTRTDRAAAELFAAGDLVGWLEAWRGSLPQRVRDLGPPLVAFDLDRLEQPEGRGELLGLLVDAGWFRAARALVARAGELGLEPRQTTGGVADARQRADANMLLLSELETLLDRRFEQGDLELLLADLEGLVRDLQAAGYAGPTEGIPGSRLDRYGPFASLVTPVEDDGAAPPGFQTVLASLGRTAILGEQFGTLDGTIRPVVARERLAGEHFGTPFGGTALWCAGVDVQSRAERAGAVLAGAAVHDGYWIDLEVVRAGAVAWAERAERLAPLVAELGAGGQLPPAPILLDAGDAARRVPLLGEGQRLGLVLLAAREGAPPTLDELFELVCVHEEGHLCDRTRFLPISERWGPGLRFFAECGFSPATMLRRLEYRAQLTALCELDEPRLVLWEVLELAEAAESNGSSGPTPHGAAYVELLDDLVDLIDEWGPGSVGLEPGRYLRWQLHDLDPAALSRLGLELARREGLVDDPARLSAL